MNKQTTNTILMVEPVAFGYNDQTAENNYFQQKDASPENEIQKKALAEFQNFVDSLKSAGVNLIVVKDTLEPHTPDSIFPNNWISFHENGYVGIYPMYAENRRAERRADILNQMAEDGFLFREIMDYTASEKDGKYLEGTGSMILDRANKVAYAAISERTDKDLFLRFCNDFHYTPVCFHAFQSVDGKRLPIYHTNVMMCVADKYAVICLDTIDNVEERQTVKTSLTESGKEIIEITEQQMHSFAGNMLQVENNDGKTFLVMSQSAFDSLTQDQIRKLSEYNKIISVPLPTIEKYGGGSARCMMAEVFIPNRNMLNF
ncbi:MAG: citrulline utilization hydrolase CtlX [Dysgonomonas sp.]